MKRKLYALSLAAAVASAAIAIPQTVKQAPTASAISISDLPSEYQYAANWIWENRISNEDSTGSKSKRYNVLFDQIIAGKGTLNYVVRWHSYKTITLAQREGLERLVEDTVNEWTDWLVGYENWPYDHVDVNIVGWAVLDKSLLLDLQSDEVVWDNIHTAYDSTYDTPNGYETIPTTLPNAPDELWSFNYFSDRNHVYPGTRFDMYLWCTQGFPSIGGCGGDWGQRLSDDAYLAMADGTGAPHVHVHELGHGFGMTDFYGGEGESDGFPPGGFPGNGTSIMMAGSSSEITDFDDWMLRYMWTKLAAEEGRFDLANAIDPSVSTEPATTTSTTTTTAPIIIDPNTGAALPVSYNSDNDYWVVQTNGATELTIQAAGLPYAALSGAYGYWNNATSEWIQTDYSFPDSLGDSGIGAFAISLPIEAGAAEVQIQVYYYAQWDNTANDMVDQDPSGLQFTAYGNAPAVTTTTTTTVPIITTTTTTSTTTAPQAELLMGDVDCNGVVNVSDAVLLCRYLAEDTNISVSALGLQQADCDGSNTLTSDDSMRLLRIIAKT